MPSFNLQLHPGTPSALRAITVHATRAADCLALTYRLEGDIGRIRVPATREARRADKLWQHTCCEIFVARKEAPAYHEFNFSPSGEWAVYAFTRYRDGGANPANFNPQIKVRSSADFLELDAAIPLDLLAAPLKVGLSAVVEETNGTISYWALAHPAGRPDFHHADAFAAEL